MPIHRLLSELIASKLAYRRFISIGNEMIVLIIRVRSESLIGLMVLMGLLPKVSSEMTAFGN